MNDGAGGETTYVLGQETRQRLSLLEEVLDPMTIPTLEAVEVEPGWRCLEVGAGGGSVARWLCSRVGPSGRVVAVDLDTRLLEELEEDNLEVHQRDIVADGLPGGGYDLVHTRFLLIHLPTRQQVLEAMVAALRPGGTLVVDDGDTFPITSLSQGVYGELWSKVLAAFEAAGMHHTWARELPTLCDRAGLESVDAACEVGVFRGGSAYAEVILTSIAQMHPHLLAVGATEELLDETALLLRDPSIWFHGWGMMSVRGRAPQR